LFSNVQLPYFVQTCKNQTFSKNANSLRGKLDNFDFDKGEDQALSDVR